MHYVWRVLVILGTWWLESHKEFLLGSVLVSLEEF